MILIYSGISGAVLNPRFLVRIALPPWKVRLIADKRPHLETKNPYFRLIHETWFCEKILAEFGVEPEQGFNRKRACSGGSRKRGVAFEEERKGDHH